MTISGGRRMPVIQRFERLRDRVDENLARIARAASTLFRFP
jgi:hypothetical protein